MHLYRALIVASLLAACGDDSITGGSGAGGGGSSANGGSGGAGGAAGLVCDETLISKGPWSLHIDETTAKIRWEACGPDSLGDVIYQPEAGGPEASAPSVESLFELTETHTPLGENPPDWAGTYYMHEASLSGLAEGTCYSYALAADSARTGRFCTARPSGDPFTFMAIGDTNPALGSTELTLSHALPTNPDFTIHGGDIQYYSSLLETWASWFLAMQPMLSQGGFFPAIGNHEVENDAELSEYSLRFFGGAGFDGAETYHQFHSGGVWFFTVNTEEPLSQGSPQSIWLQNAIETASQEPGYRAGIVFFHKPLVTCGDTGDNPAARAFLDPIFEANKILFVIQAHMHGYERFEFATGPTYLTSAGGGGVMGNVDENIERDYCVDRIASGPIFHATVFHVGATEISGEVIDRDGVTQDTFSRAIP